MLLEPIAGLHNHEYHVHALALAQRDGVALPSVPSPLLPQTPTSASKSNLCTGPCKGRSDPGCGLLDIPSPAFSGHPLVRAMLSRTIQALSIHPSACVIMIELTCNTHTART